MKYRTIVVDPPWQYDSWPGPMTKAMPSSASPFDVTLGRKRKRLDYPALSIMDIAALPVPAFADETGCHLYLWTTNRYLPNAFSVLQAWGFRYSQTLVWAKTPMGQSWKASGFLL